MKFNQEHPRNAAVLLVIKAQSPNQTLSEGKPRPLHHRTHSRRLSTPPPTSSPGDCVTRPTARKKLLQLVAKFPTITFGDPQEQSQQTATAGAAAQSDQIANAIEALATAQANAAAASVTAAQSQTRPNSEQQQRRLKQINTELSAAEDRIAAEHKDRTIPRGTLAKLLNPMGSDYKQLITFNKKSLKDKNDLMLKGEAPSAVSVLLRSEFVHFNAYTQPVHDDENNDVFEVIKDLGIYQEKLLTMIEELVIEKTTDLRMKSILVSGQTDTLGPLIRTFAFDDNPEWMSKIIMLGANSNRPHPDLTISSEEAIRYAIGKPGFPFGSIMR